MAAALYWDMEYADRRTGAVQPQLPPHGVPFPHRRRFEGDEKGRILKPWARALLQGSLAVIMLASGTIWTIHQHKPKYVRPGELLKFPGQLVLPAQVVQAMPEDEQILKVSAALMKYTKDSSHANRIATALVKEGNKADIDHAMLVGLLITEDAKLDPRARSSVGARGLLQVMPFHAGEWGCGSSDLFNVEANICHGVAILASYMRKQPNLHKALLKYNGCVRGTNTPNCHTYSGKVLKYAEEAAEAMLGAGVAQMMD